MKKELRDDLIERYLEGVLPETERQEMERRLAADPELRADLELQRTLQRHLRDPAELRLRAALDELLATPPPDELKPARSPKTGWLRLAALLALLILAGLTVWRWPSAGPAKTAPAPVQQPAEPPKPAEPKPENPQSETQKSPIAMANPADFEPNPALEARIGGVRGGGGTELELSSPAPGAAFRLQNGRIVLPVQGALTADSLSTLLPFQLFIYANRPKDWDNKQALFNLPLSFQPAGPGQYRVDFRRELQLRPGLYYVVVGQQRAPEAGSGYRTLWVGKFVARP